MNTHSSFYNYTTHIPYSKTKKQEKEKNMDGEQDKEQKPVSVFLGDGVCINRILARSESSVGKSSRVFYRSNEGVPFRWEMEPGTAKKPQEEETIPPICPSPLMQSLGLPLPNLDHPIDPPLKTSSKLWRLREMVKKRFKNHIIKKVHVFSKKQESSRFSSVRDVSMVDGPFCCSPWNTPPILDEGNTTIYYCSRHKKAFAVEEDDLFLSRILSEVSASSENFSGPFHGEASPARVPFGWEMQPGRPKAGPENEVVPPPSPPPAAQSLTLRRPYEGRERMKKSTWKKAWIWVRRYGRKKKESKKTQSEIKNEVSFRYDEGFNAVSFRKTASVSSSSSISPMTRGGGSRVRRNLEGNLLRCGPWSRRSEMLVFARRKWKSVVS